MSRAPNNAVTINEIFNLIPTKFVSEHRKSLSLEADLLIHISAQNAIGLHLVAASNANRYKALRIGRSSVAYPAIYLGFGDEDYVISLRTPIGFGARYVPILDQAAP